MQVQLLMIVHHRNLVSLVGYCNEKENMALVYEYMANGNLKDQLLGIYRITLRNIEFFKFFETRTSL
jgi:serine/threonine protein kinase